MANLHVHTDLFRDLESLRVKLEEDSIALDGCLIFPATGIAVRLQGYRQTVRVSPARVAWALAHPLEFLGVRDFAVHTCATAWATHPTRRCCIHPDHIIKGRRDNMHALRQGGIEWASAASL